MAMENSLESLQRTLEESSLSDLTQHNCLGGPPPPDPTEVDVLVGNVICRESKALLATHSGFFKTVLYGNFKKDKKVVNLEHENWEPFVDIISFLRHLIIDLPEENVVGIVRFAVVYRFDRVVELCKDLLIEKNLIDRKEKLLLADELNLERLKFDCLKKTVTLEDLRSFLPMNVSTVSQVTLAHFLHKTLTAFGIPETQRDMKDPVAKAPKPKKFKLRLVVAKNLQDVTCEKSEPEEHFDSWWTTRFAKTGQGFSVQVFWVKDEFATPESSISAKLEFKLSSTEGNFKSFPYTVVFGNTEQPFSCFGFNLTNSGEDMVDDVLVIETSVEITKMEGFLKKRSVCFDQKRPGTKMIEVGNTEFHVPPRMLSSLLPFFHSLFFGDAEESLKKRMELKKESADHFHSLLEIIGGCQVINDENVMGILELANKLGVEKAVEQCEDFIIDSNMTVVKEKVRLADKHNFRRLLFHCLNNIHTFEDLKAYLPVNVFRLKQPTLALFMHRMVIETFSLRAEIKDNLGCTTVAVVDRCGIRWELNLSYGRGGYLDVDLYCATIDDCESDWRAEAFVQFHLLTANGNGTDEKSEEKLVIFNATDETHLGMFMPGNNKYHDVVKKTFLVDCTIMVIRTVGIEKKKLIDFGSPTIHSDVVLSVGEQKFYVGSAFLRKMSPFFNRLFGSLEQTEFEVNDVDPNEFQTIMDYLYRNIKATVENVEILLKLGKKFEMRLIPHFCEEFLVGNTEINKRVKLRLADQYKLKRVLDDIVDSITTFPDLKAHLPGDVYQLQQETLGKLMEKTATFS